MPAESHDVKAKSFLPKIGSAGYYILLAAVAIFILGPLGGISAAYMNFSLGFFVGGQVLAGILGSVVTYGYGSEGKHGANYIQTMAASVAGMSGMAVLSAGDGLAWSAATADVAVDFVFHLHRNVGRRRGNVLHADSRRSHAVAVSIWFCSCEHLTRANGQNFA